ncbi:MAG: GntR family transcriptional regulator [Litoreibacter sp.]|nr:GntR family transcriptional regulator [Litoreibacter sp.]
MLVMNTIALSIKEADVSRLPAIRDLPGSLADRAYAVLRDAILKLDFLPGAVIRKSAVCERLGISRSPVSDALAKLSGEGLVDILPQSGTRVSRLSMDALREDIFMREALEVAAARHAALFRSDETTARLLRNLEMQKLLVSDPDPQDFIRTDVEMHGMIFATTKIAKLPTMVRLLSPQIDRARQLLLPEPGRLAETVEEHRKIVEAICDQDAHRAEEAMRRHVRQLTKRLEPLETARPDLFT